MRKFWLALIGLSLLFTTSVVSAHPGRTDSNGGHTCRTNCEKWGLSYGQYHYHNGGGSGSSSGGSSSGQTKSNYKKPAKPAVVIVPIVAVDNATVYSEPQAVEVYEKGYMDYGSLAYDQGSYYEGWSYLSFADGSYGYVSKNLLTQYKVIAAKQVTVRGEKGYLFNIPSDKGKVRGVFSKNAKVNVVGENGNFYFVSTVDYKGNPLKGFISKSVSW
ncbi:YHYH domain-containing protein [Brevibacillus ginsengisoli]|uniref:YHYH domain-containing protein n=1 Tax=Brevibacillus ginsengisoli TaxID=363854 RepID=UPI003CEA1CC2